MSIPCPVCGKRFTYVNSAYLVCRNCGTQTPLRELPGYEQEEAQRSPPPSSSNPMIDTILNFGVR